MEYTVHFQKGTRIGARSLRMVQVIASNIKEAAVKAKAEFPGWRQGYRLTRVDHFDEATNKTVIDW